MKAILLRQTGAPSVLEYCEVPTPRPGPGEILVKADTIGVSMPETLVRKGTYAWMPPLPAIPGIEMSGTIAETGPGVSEREVGENVFVSARDLPVRACCYAERSASPSRRGRRTNCRRGSISKRLRACQTIRSPGTCCILPRAASRRAPCSSIPRRAGSAARPYSWR